MSQSKFPDSTVFSFAESIDYADSSVVSKVILKKETGNITLFAFDKGEGLSEHTSPFEALVQIIEGEAKIVINKHAHSLTKGQSIILPADIPHAVHAVERFKMVLIMIKDLPA